MASEYSVNIKLNTSQVKKDLKTIGDGISNLGKKQEKGSKQALSDTEKRLKAENTSLGLQNRGLSLVLKKLPLDLKGVKVGQASLLIEQATTKAKEHEFELSKKNLLLADEEIKKAQIRFKTEESINKVVTDTAKKRAVTEKISPLGSFSRLSDRVSRDVDGKRTFLNNPFAGGMSRLGATRGFDFGSALISGGFPLLFGQGPIGAAAGGLGGGIGGMFGQMGGFAGGIAATAAVQAIGSTLNSVRELGDALRKPTENLKLLTERLSLTNTPTGDLIAKLEKLGMTSTAASILIEEFAERTGKTPEEVQAATKELEEFNRGMADLGLKVGFIVSDILGPAITLLNKLPLEGIAKFFMGRGFGFLNPGGALSPFKESLPQKKLRLEKSRGSGVGNNLPTNLQDVDAMANAVRDTRELLPIRQALEIEKQRFTENSKILQVKKEENKLDQKISELDILKKEAAKETNDTLDFKIEKLTAEVELQRQLLENAQILADPIQSQMIKLDQQMALLMDSATQIVALSQTIGSSFSESFKGIINGTMTVQDAFRNMFSRIADHFLDMAAQMVAAQISRGFLGMFGSLFNPFNFGNSIQGPAAGFSQVMTAANGGPAGMRQPYLVGEKGPELFVPNQSGNIIPNHDLGGVGGGSTNVVVNVDASGTQAQGNEERANDLGRLIAAAVQSEILEQQRPGGLLA